MILMLDKKMPKTLIDNNCSRNTCVKTAKSIYNSRSDRT